MPVVLESLPPALRALVPTFEGFSDGVAACGCDGRILYTNPAYETLFGVDRESFLGSGPPFPHWPEHKRQDWTDQFGRIRESGRSDRSVFIDLLDLVDAQGERLSVNCVWGILRDASGKPVAYVGLLHPCEATDTNGFGQIEMRGHTPSATVAGSPLHAFDRRILERLLQGRSVREIAEETSLGVAELRGHLRSIFRKLGVRSQSELVRALEPGSGGIPTLT